MTWPSSRHKTAGSAGSWTPADMNGVQDQYRRTAGLEADDLSEDLVDALGVTTTASGHPGAEVHRGKSIIATEESTTSPTYTTLTTADQVDDVVVPEDSLLFIGYRALWKASVSNAARAAIFLGANQLKTVTSTGAPTVDDAGANVGTDFEWLLTGTAGLTSEGAPTDASSVVTGMAIPIITTVEIEPGTYDISVQYKVSSGSVTAKERKLWVWTIGFP